MRIDRFKNPQPREPTVPGNLVDWKSRSRPRTAQSMNPGIWTRTYLAIRGKLGWGKRWMTSLFFPEGPGRPYDFGRARRYWLNVPRAQGGNPFHTPDLTRVSDEALLQDFDREVAIAREKEERRVGFRLAHESIADAASPQVMDYGCGIGFYGMEMLARHPGARVTFVDINEETLAAVARIARAKGWGGRSAFRQVMDERARDLTFDEPFDLIMAMGVLHHTPHAPEIVGHLSPFLKEGGIFLVMLYNRTYLRRWEIQVGRRLTESRFGALTDPRVGNLTNPYSEAYDDDKAKRLFAGYELLSADYPDPCYNMYRFRKPLRRAAGESAAPGSVDERAR